MILSAAWGAASLTTRSLIDWIRALTSGLLAGSALALKWVLGESDLKSLDPRETTPND